MDTYLRNGDIGSIIVHDFNVVLKGCNSPFIFNGVFLSETTKNKTNVIS